MAQFVGKYAAKKLLGNELKKYQNKDPGGPYDPYYTYYTDSRGRKKKAKKLIPAYIPDEDAEILAKVRKRAYALDCSLFNLFGQRFGWSSVVGVVPVAGDGMDSALALMLVYKTCTKVKGGLPKAVHLAMLINIALDFIVGLIPFLGDLLDAAFKANTRNVRELEKLLDKRYKPKEQKEEEERVRRESTKNGRRYESPPPASVLEPIPYDYEVPDRPEPESGIQQPVSAAAPLERRGGPASDTREKRKSSGWFSGSNKRAKQQDVEMGPPSDQRRS